MSKTIVLIGSGKWGQVYANTFDEYFPNVNLIVGDRSNWQSKVDDGTDGVIVCTSPFSHVNITKYVLDKNIPVMVEKPLSLNLEEAKILNGYNVPILINNIHLFSDSFQRLKDIVSKYKITFILSNGSNCGPTRDFSSLWDYGWHDISMIFDLINSDPIKFEVYEKNNKCGKLFNIAMKFSNTLRTFSTVGNGGENKIRSLEVSFDGLHLTYDQANDTSRSLNNSINLFLKAISGQTDDERLGLDLSFRIINALQNCEKNINIEY